jgi:NAD(P)-dependent dehydrogenase (short-subunit alcohol dehydrogenase family)
MTTNTLNGQIALVTGGTTGIGFGTAQCLIEAGATVYITGRRREVLDAAVQKLGKDAIGLQADASVKADMQQVADIIEPAHGKSRQTALSILRDGAPIIERA